MLPVLRLWPKRKAAAPALHDSVVEEVLECDVRNHEQVVEPLVVVAVRMGHDPGREGPASLESVVAPVQEPVHGVVLTGVDHDVLVIRRHDEAAVPLADVHEDHLEDPVGLYVILVHPTVAATGVHLAPLPAPPLLQPKPVSPEEMLDRLAVLARAGVDDRVRERSESCR